MKFTVPFLVSTFFISCKTRELKTPTTTSSFVKSIVDFAVQQKANQSIELPFIYDSLIHKIPDDSAEQIMIVEELKTKGFQILNWGRGNYPPRGQRIVSVIMRKESCICEVNKIYYSTVSDTLFEIAERIKCGDTSTFSYDDKK